MQIVISHNQDDAPLLRCLWSIATNAPATDWSVLILDASASGKAHEVAKWFSSTIVWEWAWILNDDATKPVDDLVRGPLVVCCHSGVIFGQHDLSRIAEAWEQNTKDTLVVTHNKVLSPVVLGALDDYGANLTPGMANLCRDGEEGSVVARGSTGLMLGKSPEVVTTIRSNVLVHPGPTEHVELTAAYGERMSNRR